MPGGGGGDAPDINQVTTSQAALWAEEAKKWNNYITKVEPKQAAAFKTVTEDPTAKFTGATTDAIYGKFNPNQILTQPTTVPNTKQFLGTSANIGGALGMGVIGAQEKAKDYTQKSLSDVAATIYGEKVQQGPALGVLASSEAKNYVADLEANNLINDAWSKANSSALSSLGAGVFSGLPKTTQKAV